MAASRADLIMHPVRIRLLSTLARRQLTARQLSELLPAVPQATLYHHLGILTRANLLRVVSERQIRGTTEKLYALADDSAILGRAELGNAPREDQLHYFTIFVASLLDDFARYLQQDAPIDPDVDGVGYRQTPLYLSDEEFAQAVADVSQALLPYFNNQPSPHRRRRLFAMIVLPDATSP
jgi:DNA-binding transcriptional ArsR family regulator